MAEYGAGSGPGTPGSRNEGEHLSASLQDLDEYRKRRLAENPSADAAPSSGSLGGWLPFAVVGAAIFGVAVGFGAFGKKTSQT